MARKHGGRSGISGGSKASAAPGARIKKIDQYEDTLEPGSVDDFMFKRDQINFNPQIDSDDEDINAGQGDEILSLSRPRGSKFEAAAKEADEEDEEEEDVAPKQKERKSKTKPDLAGKGRFGKPVVSSDEDEDDDSGSGSGSGSDNTDDERWGRSYYSRPSTRREKEKDDVDDEKREEEREMEEREVKRLQRKQREALDVDDWGLAEVEEAPVASGEGEEEEAQPKVVPAPPTSADPATLLRHLEAYEPLKLALARDFPLIVKKLHKTARGIKKLQEQEGQGELHKGLGWLHYQTLLTYATTLAYYIHLCSLPASERPNPEIPIISRLLQLKEGVAMLEDLDFAAGSVSEGGVVLNNGLGGDDDDEELQEGKMELIKRMREAGGLEWEEDADDLWGKEGLEDGELEELLRDAEVEAKVRKGKKSKKEKEKKKAKKVEADEDEDEDDSMGLDGLDEFDFDLDEEAAAKPAKKVKKAKAAAKSGSTVAPAYAPLAEPEFFSGASASGGKGKAHAPAFNEDLDVLGDPTALSTADFSDKQSRKRSLAFHTSKINQTLARRAEGRANRMGGDEDLPYRDRRKARDAALRKNGPSAEGEDLEPVSATSASEGKKRARVELDLDDGASGDGDDGADDGYYELVKRRKREAKDAKEAAHEEREADRLAAIASLDDESTEGGPRGLTRAIEKNRGLTPRRSKSGRNPRVKKRQAYEKAKKKVASQKSVYKGGQGSLGGAYSGEKTGISRVVKSRKF